MMAWEPVNFIALADGLEIHADDIAMTIGKGNTALATYAWPEDGNTYALCRQVPDGEVMVTRDQLVLMQEAMRFAWEGFGLRPQYDQTAARMQRLDNWIGEMLAQTKGDE